MSPEPAAPMPDRIIAFDLETTSPDPGAARIVEFCFIELDAELNELARWSELVDCGSSIPPETVAVHGITDEMVKGKPRFEAYAPRIQVLVQDAILIAHNHQYDLQVLHRELVAAGQRGLDPNHPCIDTLLIERYVNSHKLGETYARYTGKTLDDAHRSAADTEATVEVLRQQRARHADKLPASVPALVALELRRRFEPKRERTWLDHARRFYMDGDQVIRFAFGKHRDEPALAHDDYLRWMMDRDFADDTKVVLRRLLATRQPA